MELKGIAIRNKPRAEMTLIDEGTVDTHEGIIEDVRGKPKRRQITILSEDDWSQVQQTIGQDIHWSKRRANLLINGLHFGPESVGKRLLINDQVLLEVIMECDPCHRMDAVHPKLREALTPDWRGGICCKVINPGRLSIGSNVIWHD
jgi:MOSC domain-containing protein YiiM